MVGERRPRAGPIRFKSFLRNTILDVMRSRGWIETDSEYDWDYYWADVNWIREHYDHVRLEDHQRINHYRNHYELTRKDVMVKNFKRMRKQLEKDDPDEAVEYDFFPITFSLPQDYGLFEQEFRRRPNCVWIMKPPAKAQGKGIFLFSKLSQIADWRKEFKQRGSYNSPSMNPYGSVEAVEPYLAQRYISNPHLVGGKKYDLRIFVLVTSYNPLVVWLHRTGFARFCHHRFNLDDIDNTFIHVTNTAVQKTNPKYSPSSGCKFGIRNVRMGVTATHGVEKANKLFGDIEQMILRTLFAVQKVMIQDKHCSELYGYDVMIDQDLHPWLIETNASPSLTAETPADYHLKFNLLDDYFNVVDMEKRRKGDETRVGGFDLIWNNGPVNTDAKAGVQSHLGCANDGEIPMSQLRLPPRLQEQNISERLLTNDSWRSFGWPVRDETGSTEAEVFPLKKGKTFSLQDNNQPWVLIASTSLYWHNYRHSANALFFYDTVRTFGLDSEHVLMLLSDASIACDARNPVPGSVLHVTIDQGGERDVWEKAAPHIDFCGAGSNVETVLALLRGQVATRRTPLAVNSSVESTGDTNMMIKHLNSNENSNVLLYLVGHGYSSYFQFNDMEYLSSSQLAWAVQEMYRRGRYRRLLILLDTCNALSMCEAIAAPHVVCLASSDARSFGLSSFINQQVGIHTSSNWMDALHELLKGKTCESNPVSNPLYDSLATLGSRLMTPNAMRSFGTPDGLTEWRLADFVCASPHRRSRPHSSLVGTRLPPLSFEDFM